MTDETPQHDEPHGAEGDDSPEKDTLPAAPSPEDDAPVGDTDQHSKVPAPPADDVVDTP